MLFDTVAIASLSYVDAPHRISSSDIEARLAPVMANLGNPQGLIEKLTGIKARRFWDSEVMPSDVATLAAEKAIAAAGISKDTIGVIVNTSVSKDCIEPSVASLVHGNLGLNEDCLNFDIGNACLAFLNGMQLLGNMIERGQIDYGLIVDGEGSRDAVEATIRRLVESGADEKTFRDNFATLTLGSGAAAMVLTRGDLAPDAPRFHGGVTLAATEHNRLCIGQPTEMITNASALLVAGIGLAKKTLAKAVDALQWKLDEIDHYIMHQVGHTHMAKLCAALGVDPSKVFMTFEEFGNIGPAAVPITLAKAVEAGRIKKGDRIALMGIGSGINCSMMEVVW
jgi:acyl-CoA:acyl-CoA alkyltransferase